MFCAQCGTLVSANSRFCVACGTRVTDPPAGSRPGTLALTQPAEEQLLGSVRHALAADYDVEHELGRGGMAVVFKARDKELERTVALKVLPLELTPVATVAERFKREARLAASLDHPHIIPVYRVGQAGGVLYMAMKFIDGRPLDALVASHGPLPLAVVLTVMRAAASAIAYSHEHGIVHRDIKGANILIDRQGRVVVTDFGIARAVESATLTATGVAIGTPHFMSPEQCAGKPVGPQSDQYSLGIVAYQMLTGVVPFDGDSLPEILQHHWFTPPPDASLIRPEIPASLTVAVLRLLAKDPAQRFATTNDLVVALESIPFSAIERAAGEAGLRTLVAGGTTPRADRATDATTPPSTDSPANHAAGAASAPTTPAPPPATQPIDILRDVAPLAPTLIPERTFDGSSQPTRPPATTGARARAPQRTVTAPLAPPTGPRSNATTRARPHPPSPRWRVAVAVVVVLLLVVGGGSAVGARRTGVHPFAKSQAAVTPSRLDAAAMRDAGGKAYQSGDYELARRFFVRALVAAPGDARTQDQLGCTFLKLGQADSANVYLALSGSQGKCP
jgi:serine/threonine protein kinase